MSDPKWQLIDLFMIIWVSGIGWAHFSSSFAAHPKYYLVSLLGIDGLREFHSKAWLLVLATGQTVCLQEDNLASSYSAGF